MTNRVLPLILALAPVLLLFALPSHGQAPIQMINDQVLGGTGGEFEHIDLSNGGVNLEIPVYRIKGRGIDDFLTVNYSSKNFYTTSSGTDHFWQYNTPWNVGRPGAGVGTTSSAIIDYCTWHPGSPNPPIQEPITADFNAIAYLLDGSTKNLPQLAISYVHCDTPPTFENYTNTYATDASGAVSNGVTVTYANGTKGSADSNGNSQSNTQDSAGRTLPTFAWSPDGTTETVTLIDGRQIVLHWASVNAATAFVNPSLATNYSGAMTNMLTEIDLPNSTSWKFQYAANSYGQLTKVILPTGGYIRYTYAVQPKFATNTSWGTPVVLEDSLCVTGRYVSADGITEHGETYTYTVTAGRTVTQRIVRSGFFATPQLQTDYAYDALDNLLTVNQKGGTTDSTQWRTRTFVYDSLSRLTSSTNPEANTQPVSPFTLVPTTYSYDANGNLLSKTSPAPNQTGTATVTTNYQYDALNRLTQKSYSDGTTPTAAYLYDVSSTNGVTISNPVGRLVRATTNNCIQTINSYDQMGRITTQWLNTPSYCGPASFTPSYAYDLAGDTTSASNGMGVTISYAFDSAARPTTVTSSLVDSQHPATLFTADSSIGYFPHGALRKAAFGNGLTQSNVFNNRLQPCLIDVNNNSTTLQTCNDSTPSGNVLDLWMGYNAGTSNNGNVMNWNATGAQSFIRTYSYDSLNRIATMSDSNTGQSCLGLSWTIDPWGNRTDQTVTAGTCGTFHQSVDANNRLLGAPYQYDAAGNMTHDASHAYFYDAENRLVQVDGTLGTCSTATACYFYDAGGLRVESNYGSSTMDYIHDLSGNVVADWETSSGFTGWATGYVYLNGGLLAQYQGSTTHFAHADHLGSTRLLTGLDQSVVQNLDYLPFGELNSSDSGINTHKFTGKERDSESNLDYFGARYDSSSLGRFMSPDAGAIHLANPQSFNRYLYALNNPLAFVDPDGNYPIPAFLLADILDFDAAVQRYTEAVIWAYQHGIDVRGNSDLERALAHYSSYSQIDSLTKTQGAAYEQIYLEARDVLSVKIWGEVFTFINDPNTSSADLTDALLKIDDALTKYEDQKEEVNKAAHRVGLVHEWLGYMATAFTEGQDKQEQILRQASDQLREALKRRLEKEKKEKEEKEKCNGGAPCPDKPAPVSGSSQ